MRRRRRKGEQNTYVENPQEKEELFSWQNPKVWNKHTPSEVVELLFYKKNHDETVLASSQQIVWFYRKQTKLSPLSFLPPYAPFPHDKCGRKNGSLIHPSYTFFSPPCLWASLLVLIPNGSHTQFAEWCISRPNLHICRLFCLENGRTWKKTLENVKIWVILSCFRKFLVKQYH